MLKKHKHNWLQRIVAAAAYSTFAIMIFFSFESDHTFYNALAKDLTYITENNSTKEIIESGQLIKYLSSPTEYSRGGLKYGWGGNWSRAYCFSAFFVSVFILLDILTVDPQSTKNMQKDKQGDSPDAVTLDS